MRENLLYRAPVKSGPVMDAAQEADNYECMNIIILKFNYNCLVSYVAINPSHARARGITRIVHT